MRLIGPATILLIDGDQMLGYLLNRFAELGGYQLISRSNNLSSGEIEALSPDIMIILSTELLEAAQALVKEIADLDIPIAVCSSVADEARARKLGADYCLFHPLTYDGFKDVLDTASASKRA